MKQTYGSLNVKSKLHLVHGTEIFVAWQEAWELIAVFVEEPCIFEPWLSISHLQSRCRALSVSLSTHEFLPDFRDPAFAATWIPLLLYLRRSEMKRSLNSLDAHFLHPLAAGAQ